MRYAFPRAGAGTARVDQGQPHTACGASTGGGATRSVSGALKRDEMPQRLGQRGRFRGSQLVLYEKGAGRVGAQFEDPLVVVLTVAGIDPAGLAETSEPL